MTPSARGPLPLDLREHHGVETPEHVDVRLELAGLGSRMAAGLLDALLLFLVFVTITFAYGAVGGSGTISGWATAVVVFVAYSLFLGYFAAFEALNGGRTPGKQALGIRVVMDTGRSVTPGAAVMRNLVRLFDSFFFLLPLLPAMLSMFLHKSSKRLGDMAAGTIVVRDRPTEWVLGVPASPAPERRGEPGAPEEALEAGPPELSEDEFRLLDRFLARLSDLDAAIQTRLSDDLARRFETRIPRRTGDLQAYLVQVFVDEQRKRRGRFAVRAQSGGGRTTVTAERFLAKKRAGWERFRALAIRMERSGVGALAAAEIPEFATRYREVAADLARAHTYGLEPRVIEYLERVVSAGHNALYRTRGRRRTSIGHYLLREFPAAVAQSWAYVLVAFAIFAVPAVAGFVAIRERPTLAEEVLPPGMISRAEEAAEREARGVGYASADAEDRPAIAAVLAGHNTMIAFWTFAGGMTGGVVTIGFLAVNGWLLGLVFGLFANYGAVGHLATFVAGHGVLELTAIFISAGAGFRLARAMVAPGDRTRKDALVVEGRVAVRMVGAVVTLLAMAGAIEGLLSTSDAPPTWKYATSAATAVFLALYFINGRRYLSYSTRPAKPSSG